ncbi:Sodium-dependent dopamine transporter [Amphibalanus amphitrite]|uniref:Sodium-dependent nutrient amino acid transporter 1 n=1 Tax=Amphibalanus amphitrite TaxID=1232801 RepID=A0A6A4W3Z6_AMPAM|nr:Sodium-dependent dopamine transporter [Amphibalanus amphitrite]
MAEQPPRDRWRSQCDFLLSLIGYSVGTGNLWRFPYLCYKFGGGTFVVAYVVMLLVLGIPMYTMEVTLGQFARQSPNVLFRQLAPLFSGVGYGIIIIGTLMCFNYNVTITWVLSFLVASFRGELEWSRCGHIYNSPRCFTVAGDERCRSASLGADVFWNNTCYPAYQLLEGHAEPNSECLFLSGNDTLVYRLGNNRALASEEYFNNHVLGMNNYDLYEGIAINMKPDISQLTDPTLWSAAAAQILYSLGCGQCGLFAMGSFNRLNNNCMRDAILVSLVDTATSVIATLIVFSMLGSLAHTLCRDVGRVVTSDVGMAFVTYPEMMVHTPLPPVFSALFFVMMVSLGIDTQFIAVEALVIAAVDQWPSLKKQKRYLAVGLCVLFFLSNLSVCMDGGMLIFALVDHYAFTFSLFFVVLLQAVAVGWVYGAERLIGNMRSDMEIGLPPALAAYWRLSWRLAVPAVCLLGLATTVYLHQPASYGGRRFPIWADAVGLGIMLAPAALVLSTMLAEAGIRQGRPHRWRELLTPTDQWGVSAAKEQPSSPRR